MSNHAVIKAYNSHKGCSIFSWLTYIDSHSHSALQNAQDLFRTARIAREDIICAMEHININDGAIHQL